MPRTHPPYPPECKAEALRMARSSDNSLPALAANLGVSSEALRHWLRRDVATLRQERGSLKKAAACCAQETRWAASGPSERSGPPRRARHVARSGYSARARRAPMPSRAPPWRSRRMYRPRAVAPATSRAGR